MKVVIPGGSGQVGAILARAFHADGHDVVVLSRRPPSAPWRTVAWDGASNGAWWHEIDGCDVVINLAGRSVNCRYSKRNLKEMMRSRVVSTRAVGEAIASAARPPRVWLQASTATIYAHTYGRANDEHSGVIGGAELDAPAYWKYSIDIAQAWEREVTLASTPQTRKLMLRSAMTMSPDRGGIFDTLLRLVRWGLGGPSGNGRQFVSWIHEHDFVAAIRWLITDSDSTGVFNLAAPGPLPNAEFMRALRRSWGISFGLPAYKWMLTLGAIPLQTDTELILKSRNVVPARLLDAGFEFSYPDWESAAVELCARWRKWREYGSTSANGSTGAGARKPEVGLKS